MIAIPVFLGILLAIAIELWVRYYTKRHFLRRRRRRLG
jgi:hypothetical protein